MTMPPPIVDQEFVVHLFAPLDGPDAERAYGQVQQIWSGCREGLGMTEPIAGLMVPVMPPPARTGLPAKGAAAVTENPAGNRQAVLRRVHDVLNLSVAFIQPGPEGGRPRPGGLLTPVRHMSLSSRRPIGWQDFASLWAEATQGKTDAMLGEARLFLGHTDPGSTGAVAAAADFGESLEPLLPYQKDRPRNWWQRGTTTSAGFAVWDTGLPADTGSVRQTVVVAAADRDDELSAWVWSDGTAWIPRFAQYLLHAAKLRYEARLLDSWHHGPQANADEVAAGLNAILARDPLAADDEGPLRARLRRLRAEQNRLALLGADLARLQETVSIAHTNLRAAAEPDADDGSTGMFAADTALAEWLAEQIDHDRRYTAIDLHQTSQACSLAAEELDQLQRTDRSTPAERTAAEPTRSVSEQPVGATSAPSGISRKVFVVHGRDSTLTTRFFELLRAANLEPLEWQTLVEGTSSTAPYLGQVVANAPHMAQATLVLLSPDDLVELHSGLFQDNDLPHERTRSGQARPNVLFELGLAMMAYPQRTVVVEVGSMRPVADLVGLNVIRFNGSWIAIKKVLDRLKQAGCPVDYSGTDWGDDGRFGGLAAYRRGPDNHSAWACPGDGDSRDSEGTPEG